MKLLQKNYSKIKKFVRNANAHSQSKGRHGKAFEDFLTEQFNFPKHEQHTAEVDFPAEIVAQGNVPEELQGNWEVKYYNVKTDVINLGDVERKLKSFNKGLILVVGLYDGDPSNLVDIKFCKIRRNKEILKMRKIWTHASKYVKDRANSLTKTREFCKSINRLHNGIFSLGNISREERWSDTQQKWLNEARAITLRAKLTALPEIT